MIDRNQVVEKLSSLIDKPVRIKTGTSICTARLKSFDDKYLYTATGKYGHVAGWYELSRVTDVVENTVCLSRR
jgi:hypothetical protein